MKSEGKLRSVQFLGKVHCVRIYAVLRSKIWDGILKAEGTRSVQCFGRYTESRGQAALRAMVWGNALRSEGMLRSVQRFRDGALRT